jgi:ATP-dependent RNA helicase DDX5/DBP2
LPPQPSLPPGGAILGAGIADGEQIARVIIFCASKRGCEAVRTELRRRGLGAEALHGDKSQQERDWVLQQFRQGSAPVLIATDVASRGLDVKDVRAVVNFDAPAQDKAEDYVHRIGRAGRAGASGDAYTLLLPADAPFAREVAAMQRRNGEPVARELLFLCDDGPNGPGRGAGGGGGGGPFRMGSGPPAPGLSRGAHNGVHDAHAGQRRW